MTLHIFRHVKSNRIYWRLDDDARMEWVGEASAAMTVYRCIQTGKVWIRPTTEFNDGRFEYIGAIHA